MGLWEIAVIGVALAMDAFALTVANCTAYEKNLNTKKEWAMPAAFALFQFLMPVLGFFIGGLVSGFIKSFGSLLTAGIFFILSVKIIFDVLEEQRSNGAPKQKQRADFTLKILILQAIATSIDAFAVGITFAATNLPVSVIVASGIIGVITFIIVAVALYIGKTLGKLLGKYAVWLGAAILFCLAVKNFIEGII